MPMIASLLKTIFVRCRAKFFHDDNDDKENPFHFFLHLPLVQIYNHWQILRKIAVHEENKALLEKFGKDVMPIIQKNQHLQKNPNDWSKEEQKEIIQVWSTEEFGRLQGIIVVE